MFKKRREKIVLMTMIIYVFAIFLGSTKVSSKTNVEDSKAQTKIEQINKTIASPQNE